MKLTISQIKHLKALAHPLKFILQTGDKGLTSEVQAEIAVALKAHELIKVKLNAEREEREKMIQSITDEQKCSLIQHIGKTIILFKRNPNAVKINLKLSN